MAEMSHTTISLLTRSNYVGASEKKGKLKKPESGLS
jgi:hypothetical protein